MPLNISSGASFTPFALYRMSVAPAQRTLGSQSLQVRSCTSVTLPSLPSITQSAVASHLSLPAVFRSHGGGGHGSCPSTADMGKRRNAKTTAACFTFMRAPLLDDFKSEVSHLDVTALTQHVGVVDPVEPDAFADH